MIYLLIYAFCEIHSGCKANIQTRYPTLKECEQSIQDDLKFHKKLERKPTGGMVCVKIEDFE